MSEHSLSQIVETLQAAPAWQRKQEIDLLAGGALALAPLVAGKPVPLGDDTAVIELPEGNPSTGSGQALLLATEVIYPPLVEADPYLAGRSAVLANINDVYAMGGYPLALVDTILAPSPPVAAEILRGLRDGCDRYGVALVGGHLTATGPVTSVSACILGRAQRVLSSFNARPGDAMLHVVNLRGAFHPRFPFWDCSAHLSDADLRRDLALLPRIAEAGWCDAARDISMAGILGSMMMLLELSNAGAVVDLEAIPQPAEAAERYFDWLLGFPSYGFILCVRPQHVAAVRDLFAEHAISCAAIGTVTADQRVVVRKGGEQALLRDLGKDGFMGLAPRGVAGPELNANGV
ncbi:MAG TPA: sll0787 family AIR synthase-like protein [Roseiflexaceae bacterium]